MHLLKNLVALAALPLVLGESVFTQTVTNTQTICPCTTPAPLATPNSCALSHNCNGNSCVYTPPPSSCTTAAVAEGTGDVLPGAVYPGPQPGGLSTSYRGFQLISTDEDLDLVATYSNVNDVDLVYIGPASNWCIACNTIFNDIQSNIGNYPSVGFFMIDVDGPPDLLVELNISAMPTIILYNNGNVVARLETGHDCLQWQNKVKPYLGTN